MIDYTSFIGKTVCKTGINKVQLNPAPFKSGNQVNVVKGIINHPQLNIPAFIFEEDDSYVECRRCRLAHECIINTKLLCPHKEISGELCFSCKVPNQK